jgi:hypothetical protein
VIEVLVKLHQTQLRNLIKLLSDQVSQPFKKQASYSDLTRVQIEISEQQAGELLDELTEYLMSHGMNDVGELNQVGLEIESLIDIFNFEK